jgi:hypothetical protein
MRTTSLAILLGSTLLAASSPVAAQTWPHHRRPAPVPVVSSPSPYTVELVDESGMSLPKYGFRGRLYAEGEYGRAYSIRVYNPTARRVEVVVSVDGLDVIDGKSANYRTKRGYLIAPYGEVVIDGWRVSTEGVARFRFGSVRDSYAGKKGQARNVGVIGIAFFSERETDPVMIPYADSYRRKSREAPSPRSESEAGAATKSFDGDDMRGGLGTEFGEHQHSSVTFVPFERRHPSRPDRVTEIRYNDARGLRALGIRIPPEYPPDDVYLRETAEPFPETRFATPP